MFISFVWGGLSGGFLAREVFVQGVFVWGFMSGGVLSGGFCPDTVFLLQLKNSRR